MGPAIDDDDATPLLLHKVAVAPRQAPQAAVVSEMAKEGKGKLEDK
jgi:hypothetical protein